MNTSATIQKVDAIIIGSGFAGMYQLHSLRDKLGLNAKVIERGAGVGGTWYWNRYPGARCDSESHTYMYYFSQELVQEWEWSERYPQQAEILRYMNFVADKLKLRSDIKLNTAMTQAHFNETTNRWLVTTDTGEQYDAQFLITCTFQFRLYKVLVGYFFFLLLCSCCMAKAVAKILLKLRLPNRKPLLRWFR